MFDINTRNVEKGKNIYIMSLVIVIILLIVISTIFAFNLTKSNNLDSTTTSTKVVVKTHVKDGNTMYSPTYYYMVDNKEYVCDSDSSSSIDPGTENKTVYYDSENPFICMTEYSKKSNNFFIIFIIALVIAIGFMIYEIRKINKRLKMINELNQKGKLVKKLPYSLENTRAEVNGVPVKRVVVNYTLPTGVVVTLYGDPRYDNKLSDSDDMVDLLIDENNPDNYYIDFEINRLSGNLPEDYSNPSDFNQDIRM